MDFGACQENSARGKKKVDNRLFRVDTAFIGRAHMATKEVVLHNWLNSSFNNCCSCGWQCPSNATGCHDERSCKSAYRIHLAEATQKIFKDARDHFARAKQYESKLQRDRNALLVACKRVTDSPFEPDKWRLEVDAAIAQAEAPCD
jgi:hypothetical protein